MYQLSPAIKKAILIYTLIGLMQIIYLFILTTPNPYHILSFAILFLAGCLSLFITTRGFYLINIQYFQSKVYTFLFILSLVSIISTSRFDYIINTIDYGLASTRLSEDIGRGGFFSVINAMFYPLGMLAVFQKKNNIRSMVIFSTLIITIIDIVFIGTRNAPFFIFIYFFIFNSNIKFNIKYCALIILIAISLLYAFEITTRERSGFAGIASDYWYFKAIDSDVMSGSILNLSIFDWAYSNLWGLLPFFYFIAYVSHSIADFTTFIINYSSWFNPTFAHLTDQLMIYIFGDRSFYQETIESMRVRSGYYQTMYTSLLIDFGILFIGLFPLYFILKNYNKFIPIRILLICFISLSLIENYFIQGLKPLHFLFFIFYFLLFIKATCYTVKQA